LKIDDQEIPTAAIRIEYARVRFRGGEWACAWPGGGKLGLEGIVSKRKVSAYRSGRSPDWLKSKNPACAAVKREAEEDLG
jgi:ATP-dependent DNA ligase